MDIDTERVILQYNITITCMVVLSITSTSSAMLFGMAGFTV